MHPDIKNALDGNDSGSWLEVFNEQAGEIFSAYCIASYVEKVASAGKAEYDLPLFVNCWLDNGGRAGFYPSGGPIAKVMEVWKYVAKSIDFYAPDIYVKDFVKICQDYTKLGNPLFIPETATHSHCAPRLVYSIGHHHATCFAPFGFEDMGLPFTNSQAALFGVDVTDPLLAQPQSAEEYRWCADNLGGMMNLLTAAYGTKKLQATISEGNSRRLEFDKFGFSISMDNPYIIRTDGVCLILQIDENSFYVMANACVIDCFSLSKDEPNVDLLAVDEGKFVAGEFVKGRRLNGDETASLKFENFGLVRLKLFAYGE